MDFETSDMAVTDPDVEKIPEAEAPVEGRN
jgi:hypothetical protein